MFWPISIRSCANLYKSVRPGVDFDRNKTIITRETMEEYIRSERTIHYRKHEKRRIMKRLLFKKRNRCAEVRFWVVAVLLIGFWRVLYVNRFRMKKHKRKAFTTEEQSKATFEKKSSWEVYCCNKPVYQCITKRMYTKLKLKNRKIVFFLNVYTYYTVAFQKLIATSFNE